MSDRQEQLEQTLNDYQILTSGPWDDESRNRQDELARTYRTAGGLATTIADLCLALHFERQASSR